MVRNNTATETRTLEGPEDVEVGDTVDISGKSFLPKSNLEVTEVDPEWADTEGRVFVARIPNRSNARDYTFVVRPHGSVVTTNSRGVWDNYRLEAKNIDEGDTLTAEGKDEVFAIDAILSDHGHKCRDGYDDRADEVFDVVSKVVDEEARVGDVAPGDMSVEFTVAETRIVYEALEYAVEGGDFDADVASFAREAYRALGGSTPEPDGGPTCEACDRDGLVDLPDDDGRGEFACEWCGAFVDEDGRLPRSDDKRCPKCDGPVAYGVLKDARKGIRGYLCVGECDERRIVRPVESPPVATDGGIDRCDECGRYAAHTFDHAPSCTSYTPIEDPTFEAATTTRYAPD